MVFQATKTSRTCWALTPMASTLRPKVGAKEMHKFRQCKLLHTRHERFDHKLDDFRLAKTGTNLARQSQ